MPTVPDGARPDAVSPAVVKAADLLAEATRTGVACPPVRDLFDVPDLATAYAVQQLNVRRGVAAGRRVVGRKIGLTSPAVQRQLGVDQPDFGALFADMAVPDGGEVPVGRLLQPKVEAEVALVLGRDLPERECTVVDVLRAVDFALPRWRSSTAGCGTGDLPRRHRRRQRVLRSVRPGRHACPADRRGPAHGHDDHDPGRRDRLRGHRRRLSRQPLTAAVWLASALAERGDPLRAGDLVLTGALGPMTPAAPGDAFEARISDLGSVRVRFAKDTAEEAAPTTEGTGT